MRIGEDPLLPRILEGDGLMEHMLERDFHRVPDLIEQGGLENFLISTVIRMCASCFPLRLVDRHTGLLERGHAGRRIDLDRHQIFHRRLVEMLRKETGLRRNELIGLDR